nr:tetratricopeptide repeat protein [Bacteroidales bacterium]
LLKNLGLLKIEEYDYKSALDYLLEALKLTSKSNKRVLSVLYHSIGYVYGFLEKYKESIKYLKKALKVRKELKYLKGISQTLNRIGLNYFYQCDYEKAIKYLNDAYKLRKDNKESKKAISSSLNNIMVVYHKKGEYKLALERGRQALKIFDDLKLRHESSFVLNNIGLVYFDMALYAESLQYQFKALEIKEKSNNLLATANSLSNIGHVFNKLSDYEKAMEYENRALELRVKMKNERGIAESYNEIGNIFDNKKEYKKAFQYYKKSIQTSNIEFHKSGIAETLENIGMLYYKTKKFDKALENLFESMKIKEALDEKKGISSTYKNIAQLYFTNKEYKKSLEYSNKSFEIAKKYDHKDILQDNYELMAKIYSTQKKYKKSLDCYKRYLEIHDEIINIQRQNEIFNIYLKYENDKQEKENEIYKLKNIQLVHVNEKLKESRKDLQKINASKDKFFNILAHDLKNPFSILYTTSEILSSYYNELSEKKRTEYINTIQLSAKHILKLIENLLEWSRSQKGNKQFNPVDFNLHEVINSCLSLLKPSSDMKDISIDLKVEKKIRLFADKNMIKTILRNLLTNAIKFSNKDGKISISAIKNADEMIISVQDNGVGIKKKDQSKLFSIDKHFVTIGTSNERGTGIGLLLCEEFIKKHNGKIWIESKIGKGSKFIFSIPSKY